MSKPKGVTRSPLTKGMARENYQSYSRETGSEPNWRMRSSGPQKLRSSVKTKVPGDESPIPDINGEPTPKLVQVEDTNVPESSNTSPYKRDQIAIPEKRTSSGRLVTKPIR
ncbi:unnamed protein product [Porites evermanni]|uniref:Uncharacterized protein n=1 Tax=Porites evermanni TaxID=104178 RepID=A0ABN8SLR0_9CNID|nr:unnamed protein product [Porites evermanni]